MRNLQKYLSYLALLITTLVISACSGGSCATAPNNGQLPLAYTFPDGAKLYGNTAVNVNSGSSTTGTFVLQGSGGESTAVTLIATQKLAKQATGSLQRAAEISGKFNPRTLSVTGQGSESVSTLTVTVEDNLPAGTYTLGLYAVNLTVNGEIVSLESQIGTLTVEVKGGVSPTPTPSPTVTPTPTPSPTPTPTPVAGTLQIAPPAESIINSGATTTAVVSLENSENITTPVAVTITSNNPAIMTVEPASCNLTTASNNCTITLTGKSAGSATFSTAASGYTSVTSESVAVVATWTWVSGSNIVNAPGNYGIKGVESSGNISGARQGSISWRDESGNFWLFGGRGRAESGSPGNLNDLWRYNPVANAWTWVSGSNITNRNGVYGTLGVESVDNIPGARLSSISWRDESGNLWLFGGDGYPNAGSSGNLNDLWRYNPVTNAWTWVSGNNIVNRPGVYGTQGIESTTNIPGARSGSISWRDESGNLWLFGGYGYAESSGVGNLNDLWKYNPVTNAWTWVSGNNIINRTGVYGTKGIEGVGNIPGSRNGSVSWRDESGNLWLFGGSGYAESGGVGSLNDLWRYNPVANAWTWVSGSNTINRNGVYGTLSVESVDNIPGARLSSISWRDESGNLWLFGGYGYAASGNPDRLNDLWKYNPQTNLWTWGNGESDTNSLGIYGTRGIPSESNIAGARQFSISWYNSGQLWLFGGNGYAESGRANILNDLWVYKY